MSKEKSKYSPSTLKPSHPNAFKSCFFIEDTDWDAHIKVDYDSNVNPIDLNKIVRFLIKNEKAKNYTLKIFKTGKGHHLRIWLIDFKNKIIPASVILGYQRDLNDDPIRQRFNAERVKRGEPYWNVLWNLKIQNGKEISKEIRDTKLENELIWMLSEKAQKQNTPK